MPSPRIKPWYESKTLWLNLVFGVATAAWPYIRHYMSPEQAGAILVIANMALRFVTSQAIKAPILDKPLVKP